MSMNTETKHTPGPWYPYENKTALPTDFCKFGVSSKFNDIAFCDIPGLMEGEADANARLIAAAPELLEALQALVETCEYGDHNYEEYNNAYKAIAKATGQES